MLTIPDTPPPQLVAACALNWRTSDNGGRRRMKARFWAALLAILATIIGSTPVYAGEHWCEEDPILTIDGRTVDYTASFPMGYADSTTVNWTFHIPSNVLLATAITPPAVGSPA